MKSSLQLLCALALLSSAAAEGALAQDHDVKTSDQVLEDYTECVASRRSGKTSLIQKYLSVPLGEEIPSAIIMQLIVSDCLEGAGQLRMADELFGRALYSALYRRDFRKDELHSFDPAVIYDGEFDPDRLPISDNQKYVRAVGDCVASRNPLAAHLYVVAKVWSPEEERVLPEVASALAQCHDAGQRMAFSRSMLKGILAESLYKYRKGMTQTERAEP